MFATDCHLLPYEPRLFQDVAWAGQRLVSSTNAGTINALGDRLTISGAALADWGVEPGWVVVVNDTPLEITEVLNGTQARVSRVRSNADEPPRRAAPGAGLPVLLHTFRHQIDEAGRMILRSFGLVHSLDAGPDDLTEAHITNAASLRGAAVFGALQAIFDSASTGAPQASMLQRRAEQYSHRFAAALRQVRLGLDLTGDGLPDEVRRLDASRLERS